MNQTGSYTAATDPFIVGLSLLNTHEAAVTIRRP